MDIPGDLRLYFPTDFDTLCPFMDRLQTTETEENITPQYTFISSNEDFRKILRHLKSSSRLAIDIEADSLYHYFEKVCLIQISSDSRTFILDPLSIEEIASLAPMMADASVEKVFHAPSYDFYCLRRDYGFEFRNIFDTHTAAQLLGYEFLGLGALMEELLSIHHSKRRQRDDWSHRPLKLEQLEYAAMDTHHLLRLRDTLEEKLKQRKRLDWAREEFETAVTVERPPREFDAEGYRRIKGSRGLEHQEQAVLRALYILRDRIAREMDVPPFKVLNNSVLVDLSQNPPREAREMFHRRGVSYRVARKYAGNILKTIHGAQREPPAPANPPARNNRKSQKREGRLLMEALRSWRKSKAEELKLPVGVIFPANLLESLSEAPPADMAELGNVPGIRRWRVREFGEEVLDLLARSGNGS
jgi:ribonuclease D